MTMAEPRTTREPKAKKEQADPAKLQELFPTMSESVVLSVLETKQGNVTSAIDTLLTLADDSEESKPARRKEGRAAAIERRARERKLAKAKRKKRRARAASSDAKDASTVPQSSASASASEVEAGTVAAPPTECEADAAGVAATDSASERLAEISLEPIAAVFTRTQSLKDDEKEQERVALERVIEKLNTVDVPREHVCIVDASSDFELMSFLKETFGGEVSFPLVKVGAKYVGSVEQLEAMPAEEIAAIAGAAYEQSTGPEEAHDTVYVGRGVLDACLDAAEYAAYGVSSLVWLPVTLLTWPFSRSTPEIPKGPRDVEFDLVHTNWYWRNLKRRFRFADAHIYRIHPVHGDIRAAHLYTAVESVTRRSPTSLVICYNDGSTPDEVHAVEKVCDEIIQLITKRAEPHVVKVENAVEEEEASPSTDADAASE